MFLCVKIDLLITAYAGHYIIPGSEPYDGYHELHLKHDPPLYPVLHKVPQTAFSCAEKSGYFADTEAACQV